MTLFDYEFSAAVLAWLGVGLFLGALVLGAWNHEYPQFAFDHRGRDIFAMILVMAGGPCSLIGVLIPCFISGHWTPTLHFMTEAESRAAYEAKYGPWLKWEERSSR